MKFKKKIRYKPLFMVLIMVFVFSVPFVSYGATPAYSGTLSVDTLISYYQGQEPYIWLESSGAENYLDSLGIDYSSENIANLSYVLGGGIDSSNASDVLGSYFRFVTNVQMNLVDYDLTDLNGPRVWTYSTLSGSNYYNSYGFVGDGMFAVVCDRFGACVISDQTFQPIVYIEGSWNGYGFPDAQVYQENSGLYVLELNDAYGSERLDFTNLPLYIGSVDGSTGFYDRTDFVFNTLNIDCNYLFNSGSWVDPSAPPAPNPYVNDKYYLNFSDTSYYTGGAITSFFHNNNFTFNEYVLLNPRNYGLHFEYTAKVKRNNNTYIFNYSAGDIQLAYLLGQSTRFNTGSRLIVPLSSDWFVDGNGHSMSAFLKGMVYDVEGTTGQFSNPNDILEDDTEVALDPIFIFRTDQYIQKNLPSLKGSYNFQEFEIEGYVTLFTLNDSNFESFSYHDKYDWKTKRTDVLSTDNTIPPYTSDDELPYSPSITDKTYPSSSHNYEPGSVNPTINVTVNGGGSNAPWTPYTLDQISYGNIKDMFNDIKDFVDSTSENSFWAVLERTYSYIPAQIWNYLIISVAVICGFAVVRFVLRR